MFKYPRDPIYLDYMATTPLDPRVKEVMLPYLDERQNFGNPASTHFYGLKARQAVEDAREQVAHCINADPREIVWTSGATEANNLALKGVTDFYQRKGKHIITSAIEHKAVLDTCHFLESQGFAVTYLQPDSQGHLSLEQVFKALRNDTILLSLMLVNNEIGVINDISAIAELTQAQGVMLHVDAAQAVGKMGVDVKKLKADLLSLSAHKAYGPKGVGALYVRRGVHLTAQMHGGGHEFGMRSGTLPTQQIVGMGKAFELVEKEGLNDEQRICALRDLLWQGLQKLDDVTLNGDFKYRVANNLNVSFGGVAGEKLFLSLSDVAVSAGSACSAASVTPSYVLTALGVDNKLAASSVRFSLGRFTSKDEIEYVIKHVQEVVQMLRNR